jgi:hypothetical protein
MGLRLIGPAIAVAVVASWPQFGSAAPAAATSNLAKQLLQGCLQSPSEANLAKLAQAIGATPYSPARIRRELGKQKPTIFPNPSNDGEGQRTQVTVTAFRGWDLPGPGAGSLEYTEQSEQIDQIELVSGQPTTAPRASHNRSCDLNAPVTNGRAMFELYETLHDQPYGLLISPDRRNIHVFVFDPDRFDIELGITLDEPLAGLAPAAKGAPMARLVLADGGDRFIDEVSPGVPIVKFTRAALLAGLDHPAAMSLGNMVIEPVVQRLAAIPNGVR